MTPVDRNLSILIVLPGLSAGGVERVVSNIANYWQSKGHQITIAIFTRSHVPFYTLNSEITIKNFAEEPRVSKLLGIHSIWVFIFLLRKLIKIQRPNVVLSFLPQVNIITILAAIGLQARTIISERNEISKKHIRWPWHILRRLLYRWATSVTINSETNRKYLENFVPPENIIYLPNPMVFCHKPHRRQRDKQLIVSIGRLHRQKGYDVLIEGFFCSNVWRKGWKLEIVGKGSEKESLLALIKQYNLEGSITISDPSPNIWDSFSDAMLFAMPSRYEGTPNALLEALELGLIPLVSDGIGELANQIKQYDANLVSTIGSANALATSIRYATTQAYQLQSSSSDFQMIATPFHLKNAIKHWDKLILDN